MKKPSASFLIIVFLGAFYTLGTIALVSVSRDAFSSMQAGDWPTAEGRLTELALERTLDEDNDDLFNVKVGYSYSVNSVEFQGDRLAFGYTSSRRQHAHEEILSHLQNAKSISVRYNPDSPAESCLSYGLHRSITTNLGSAAILWTFLIGFSVLYWIGCRNDSVIVRSLIVVKRR